MKGKGQGAYGEKGKKEIPVGAHFHPTFPPYGSGPPSGAHFFLCFPPYGGKTEEKGKKKGKS